MSDLSRLLAEATARILRRHSDGTVIADPDALCAEFLAAGLHLVMVPDADGGAAGTLGDAAAVARGLGHHAAPLPFAEIAIAARIASQAGRPDLIGRALWADWSDGAPIVPAVPGFDQAMIGCRKTGAVWLAPAQGDTYTDLSGRPALRLPPDFAANPEDRIAFSETQTEPWRDAMLLTAAMALGAMERVCEIVIDHAGLRKQFGRKISAFQAIQHLIADNATEVALTAAMLDAAIGDDGPDTDRLIESYAAKLQSAQASGVIAANAHQIIGAIGFTEEHSLHHFSKRLWLWRDAWANEAECCAAIARIVRETAPAVGHQSGTWPAIVGGPRSSSQGS